MREGELALERVLEKSGLEKDDESAAKPLQLLMETAFSLM
jgi:hypothetical protein